MSEPKEQNKDMDRTGQECKEKLLAENWVRASDVYMLLSELVETWRQSSRLEAEKQRDGIRAKLHTSGDDLRGDLYLDDKLHVDGVVDADLANGEELLAAAMFWHAMGVTMKSDADAHQCRG